MLYVWQIRLDRITRPLSQNLGFGCLSLHQKHHFPAAVWVSICLKLGWIFCLLYGQKSTASVQRQPRKGPAKILKAENPKPKFKGRDLRITLLCCILLTDSFNFIISAWSGRTLARLAAPPSPPRGRRPCRPGCCPARSSSGSSAGTAGSDRRPRTCVEGDI